MPDPKRPTRRDVLLTSALAAGVASLPQLAAAMTNPGTRPNIVLVVCHDIFAPLLGTYGNPLARTPTIDRLARDGIRFDNAFSVAPVCAPSRFALVTGMYPDSCGPANQMRAVGHVPPEFKSLPELMRAAGYYATNNVLTDYNCDLDPNKIWDECSITAHWRNRPADKPFFCVYNYLFTHESRLIHFEGELATDPARVQVPPYLPDRPEIRRAIAENIDLVGRQDVALARLLGELDRDGLSGDTIVIFTSDHGGLAPRSKRYLYDEGTHIPLIVRVPHRFASLRANLVPGTPTRQVVSNIDMAPTVLALAGVSAPSYMSGKPFLGARAQSRTVAFSSRNRMDERYDMVRAARDERFRYIRNYSPHRIYGLHNGYEWQLVGYQVWEQAHLDGRLTKVQDRFWNEKPAEELYDLERDPYQIHNLANDRRYRNRLHALSRALDEHLIATNDNGFIPEGAQAEGYWQSRRPGAFPIRDVMALARLATRRDPVNAAVFVARLGHENECIRYWAAQGMLMLRRLTSDHVAAARRTLATETSPQVRCVLAELLGRAGDPELALQKITAILRSRESSQVKLQAIEALTYLPLQVAAAARQDIINAGKIDVDTGDAANYLVLRIDGQYTPKSQTFVLTPQFDKLVKSIGDPEI